MNRKGSSLLVFVRLESNEDRARSRNMASILYVNMGTNIYTKHSSSSYNKAVIQRIPLGIKCLIIFMN